MFNKLRLFTADAPRCKSNCSSLLLKLQHFDLQLCCVFARNAHLCLINSACSQQTRLAVNQTARVYYLNYSILTYSFVASLLTMLCTRQKNCWARTENPFALDLYIVLISTNCWVHAGKPPALDPTYSIFLTCTEVTP